MAEVAQSKGKWYQHIDDGRVCQYNMFLREWMHWDHKVEPAPQQRIEYRCEREHYPTNFLDADPRTSDRGEFGMPTLGAGVGDIFQIFTDTIAYPEALTARQQRVLGIVNDALELHLEKSKGYGDDAVGHLGAKGQYSDIWRKVGKLKHTLWDGNEAVGESVEEMLMDLIGHCALTIDFLREEQS